MINVDVQVTYGSWPPPRNIYDDLISLKSKAHTHENGMLLDSIDSGMFDEIAANTAARHTHENAATLGKLGENNGSLTYDGKAVGGRQTARVTLESNEFYPVDTDVAYTTMIIVEYSEDKIDKIPENSEIISIELNTGTADSPLWFDLRDMIVDYSAAPYMLSLNRFKLSTLYGGYLLVSIYFPLGDKNELIQALDSYEISQIRVTYYI